MTPHLDAQVTSGQSTMLHRCDPPGQGPAKPRAHIPPGWGTPRPPGARTLDSFTKKIKGHQCCTTPPAFIFLHERMDSASFFHRFWVVCQKSSLDGFWVIFQESAEPPLSHTKGITRPENVTFWTGVTGREPRKGGLQIVSTIYC